MADQSRVALVTGASRAISPYIARSLADAAYRLILTGRSASELNALANELNAVAVPADLTSPDELEAIVEVAERELGGVDVLVNNAGGDPQREFDAMSWPDNASILELNLIAPMRLTHRLLPGMLRCGRGHVVNTSSIAGRVSFPCTEAYAAAKDGLIGFTRVLRTDYRGRGANASVVVLGAIRDAGQGQRTAEELGLKLPPMSTSPACTVARAVLAAIRRDRAEIVVMPGPGRLIKALMDLFLGLGPAMRQAVGANATMQAVIKLRKQAKVA